VDSGPDKCRRSIGSSGPICSYTLHRGLTEQSFTSLGYEKLLPRGPLNREGRRITCPLEIHDSPLWLGADFVSKERASETPKQSGSWVELLKLGSLNCRSLKLLSSLENVQKRNSLHRRYL
jgi:hypothetical protein